MQLFVEQNKRVPKREYKNQKQTKKQHISEDINQSPNNQYPHIHHPQKLNVQMLHESKQSTFLGIVGCLGGMFIHLIIGAYFQWGFINVYITSYYKLTQPQLTLQSNGIVFPLMQLSIAPTMKIGVYFASLFGSFTLLVIVEILIALIVFLSSYISTFIVFVFVFGMGIGILSGLTFLIPLIQCNKYIVGKRMHINGVILIGTGLGSMIFGQFVYNYLNPLKVPSNNGYYDDNLSYIAEKVPQCLRYLSLLYLGIGLLGALMMRHVIKWNQNEFERKTELGQLDIKDPIICDSMWQAIKTPVFYAKAYVIIFAVCGNLVVNGNFKTYVQNTITDDNYLTLVGTIGSLGNAFCRFLWNMCFNKIGYRYTLAILALLNTITFLTIRYTVQIKQVYCLIIFVVNSCLGGYLVLNITHSHLVFGIEIGSNLDLFYWSFFSLSNFIGYFYVSYLTDIIGFNNIFYICTAMNVSIFPLLIFFHFQSKWTMAQNGIINSDTQAILYEKKIYDKKMAQLKKQIQQRVRQLDEIGPSNPNQVSEMPLKPRKLQPIFRSNKVANMQNQNQQ